MLGKLSCVFGLGHCAEILKEKQSLDYVSVFALPDRNEERSPLIFSL